MHCSVWGTSWPIRRRTQPEVKSNCKINVQIGGEIHPIDAEGRIDVEGHRLHCEDYDDRLMEFALGTLAPDESAPLRTHLANGCPRCAALLAEFQTTVSMLPLALPNEAPPVSIRQRLLDRAARDVNAVTESRRAISVPNEPENRRRIGPAIFRAVAACLAVGLGLAYLQQHNIAKRLASKVNQQAQQNADLRNALASEAETIHAIGSPSNLMVSMEGAIRAGGEGRIFIDPKLGKWWCTTRGLRQLPAGKIYEFWLIPQNQKPIPAGTFSVDASGSGYLTGAVPANIGASAIAAVTDEPAGGVPQPTGQIQIKGEIGN
jgi:anti-sigma-K factor RskA